MALDLNSQIMAHLVPISLKITSERSSLFSNHTMSNLLLLITHETLSENWVVQVFVGEFLVEKVLRAKSQLICSMTAF
jgi:hypothetical protein